MGSSNGNDITGRYLKIVAAGIGVWALSVVLAGIWSRWTWFAGTRPVG